MFQKSPKTVDAVTHKYLSLLLVGSMCLLISCGNQQVSEPSSTSSVSISTTTETLPPSTTTSTIPFNTWLETASREEMCAKVAEIWRTEPHWPQLGKTFNDAMNETFRKQGLLLGKLEWTDAIFIEEDMRLSWDRDRDRASRIIETFLEHSSCFDE